MKKLIRIAVASVVVLALLRLFGPALRDRAMAKCQEMFDRMPEEFPPKRVMRGIEDVRDQNSQILRRLVELESQQRAATGGEVIHR